MNEILVSSVFAQMDAVLHLCELVLKQEAKHTVVLLNIYEVRTVRWDCVRFFDKGQAPTQCRHVKRQRLPVAPQSCRRYLPLFHCQHHDQLSYTVLCVQLILHVALPRLTDSSHEWCCQCGSLLFLHLQQRPVWCPAQTPGLNPYGMVVTAARIFSRSNISDVLVTRQSEG